jgi:hypothetical protein
VKSETGSQIIMQCSSKNLFIEGEKCKALFVSQRFIELRRIRIRLGAKLRKNPNEKEVLEACQKNKIEPYPVLVKSSERKIFVCYRVCPACLGSGRNKFREKTKI